MNNLEKEFAPYTESLELKELGFDEPCFAQYRKYDAGEATLDMGFSKNEIIMQFHKLSKFCSAPTFSQAFRWFREKYGLYFSIQYFQYDKWCLQITTRKEDTVFNYKSIDGFKTYEEAELACLRKLIEIVKEKTL